MTSVTNTRRTACPMGKASTLTSCRQIWTHTTRTRHNRDRCCSSENSCVVGYESMRGARSTKEKGIHSTLQMRSWTIHNGAGQVTNPGFFVLRSGEVHHARTLRFEVEHMEGPCVAHVPHAPLTNLQVCGCVGFGDCILVGIVIICPQAR